MVNSNMLLARIKQLREELNVQQRQMADAIGVDAPMYSRIERGIRPFRDEYIAPVAQMLKIDEDELRSLWTADSGVKSILVYGVNKLGNFQVLTNPQLPPTPALLQEVLGDNFVSFNAVMTMLGYYDIISEWNYYKDGKSWLCKALYKKKTILWLSVWNDCFKLSFFFTEKTKVGIESLEISPAIKERFNQQKAAGKLLPLIIDVRDCTLLSDTEQIVEYKMRCK